MMICSQPAPFYEDRPTDHVALEAATLARLRDLDATEVDFLAMACHTVHIYHAKLAARLRKPLLDMVEIAASALPPTATTVALIAARPTVESGIYQRALSSRGLAVAESTWQSEVDALLGLVRRSSGVDELTTAWQALLEPVATTGADLALVACLDLTGVLTHAPRTMPIVDAARSLAEEIVRTWLALRG